MHHIGVIGGSGLYALDGLSDTASATIDTPYGAPSGAVRTGTLGGTRFYFLARHGEGHRFPPSRVNYRANVWALKAAGAQQLVSVSAVGSLQPQHAPGDLVIVDQFIDRTRGRASSYFDEPGVVAHVSMADPVDAALSVSLAEAAEALGARVHRGGTYLCMEGPQFSTRAESRLHQSWGASVIGMTNLPEAKLAREAELPYASMCFVTDYDAWHETEEAVTVDQVIAVLNANVATARRVLASIVSWPDPARSPAHTALDGALLTPKQAIDAATRERLGLLLGRSLGIDAV
jgi:5'-methylthioadenosine phosphorylase